MLNSWDIFCKVIDNYGDIGVSYRLAKELTFSYNKNVRLFVDKLLSFKKIEPEVDIALSNQTLSNNIEIIKWDNNLNYNKLFPSEVILEMFACHLDYSYIENISDKNIWINVEYLTAEKWVEDCHCNASLEKGKKKYFFFPGFSNKTGGLNFEKNIFNKKFFDWIKIYELEKFIKKDSKFISIFIYSSEILKNFILSKNSKDIVYLVFKSFFSKEIIKENNLIKKISDDTYITIYGSVIKIIPFLNFEEYDSLLNFCDINFVRGEDSFLRAQFANSLFFWQIYKQEEDYHFVKLEAFNNLYAPYLKEFENLYKETSYMFNKEEINFQIKFKDVLECLPKLKLNTHLWTENIIKNGSLASNLVNFVNKLNN